MGDPDNCCEHAWETLTITVSMHERPDNCCEHAWEDLIITVSMHETI
jgi:hypothetical protein